MTRYVFSALPALLVLLVVACKENTPPPAEPVAVECPTIGDRACKESSDCGRPDIHCTGGRCYANQASCPCTEVSDCGGEAHCAKGLCYPRQAGTPCNGVENECGPRAHCTAGSCYADTAGSPCNKREDCGPSSTCVSGTCN